MTHASTYARNWAAQRSVTRLPKKPLDHTLREMADRFIRSGALDAPECRALALKCIHKALPGVPMKLIDQYLPAL